MKETLKLTNFISVHSISSNVDHTIDFLYLRARDIQAIAPCSHDHTKLGGATSIYVVTGQMYVVTETVEEVAILTDEAEKAWMEMK